MDTDPAVEIVNSENRKSLRQLGPIQPTFDFPATVTGNGRRYKFQVSKWYYMYSVQPEVILQLNFGFKYSNAALISSVLLWNGFRTRKMEHIWNALCVLGRYLQRSVLYTVRRKLPAGIYNILMPRT